MSETDQKLFASIFLALLVFVGLPFVLWYRGYLLLRKPGEVFLILGTTIILLGIKAFITYYAKQSFTVTDHGFQLCLLAFGGYFTMWGLKALNDNINFLGDQIQLGGIPLQLTNTSLLAGAFFSLFSALMTSIIVNRRQTTPSRVGSLWRLGSYAIGIVNFAFYLVILVSKGV